MFTSINQLAERVGFSVHDLTHCAEHFDRFVVRYDLIDPNQPNKAPRRVISTGGKLRQIQNRLLRDVLIPRIRPSPYNHGGVRGRSIVTNILNHCSSEFAWKTDIASFFPSISRQRVHSLFHTQLGCDGRTAGIITRLCTHDNHLALGLPTSPLIADRVAKRMDVRIAGVAERVGLSYSRYVDDVVLSGPFSLSKPHSRIGELIQRIINDCGFETSQEKTSSGRLQDSGFTITKLRLHGGRIDVGQMYLDSLNETIRQHHLLSKGIAAFVGPLLTRDMLRSKIFFAAEIRPGRRRELMRAFGSINWQQLGSNARNLGLIVQRKMLRRVSEEEVASTR